jgi:copper chaperone CopZ
MKTYTFHVSGTHCPSCKIFIEDTLNEQIGIDRTNVDLKHETVTINTTLNENKYKLAEILTEKIKHNGYFLSVEKKDKDNKDDGVIWQALPIGLALLALFFIVQKSGILNFGLGGTVTPVTSFIIGLIASVSSCLAVVGGLVLSLSATVSQDKISDVKPMVLFHGGRLISFAILGGVLGTIGNVIGISFTFTAILGIIASIVMIVLGLNLLGIFEKNMIALPSGAFNFFRKIEHKNHSSILGWCRHIFPTLWIYPSNAGCSTFKWFVPFRISNYDNFRFRHPSRACTLIIRVSILFSIKTCSSIL